MRQEKDRRAITHFRMDLRKLINHKDSSVSSHFETKLKLWEGSDQWAWVKVEAVGTNVDGSYIFVEGKVKGIVSLDCSRCLVPFEQELSTSFEAQCDIRNFHLMAENLPVKEGEEITSVFDANSVDLLELARQSVVVQLSMRPLCRQDCKGLCPQCGINLNEGKCSCSPIEERRWTVLNSYPYHRER